jgi:GGDEF domain-containing protein
MIVFSYNLCYNLDMASVAETDLPAPRTLHELAFIDELTGLPNRARFNEQLDLEVRNNPGNFGLSFVDINGLKEVNDTGGHKAGDELLQTAAIALAGAAPPKPETPSKPLHRFVAETITKTIRKRRVNYQGDRRKGNNEEDRVFRLSGDEFVIILSGADTQEKVDRADERIVSALEENDLSASVGGRPHRENETGAQLLHDVDQIMYARKRQLKRQEYKRKVLALPTHKFIGHVVGRKLTEASGVKLPHQR